jgi:hypothetical protein
MTLPARSNERELTNEAWRRHGLPDDASVKLIARVVSQLGKPVTT